MNINRFTQNSIQAVQNCEKIAADNGNQELAQEHLLYALLTQDDSLILKLLEKMSIQGPLFINRVEELLNKRPKVQGGQVFVGQDLNNALIHAEDECLFLTSFGLGFPKISGYNIFNLSMFTYLRLSINIRLWGQWSRLIFLVI